MIVWGGNKFGHLHAVQLIQLNFLLFPNLPTRYGNQNVTFQILTTCYSITCTYNRAFPLKAPTSYNITSCDSWLLQKPIQGFCRTWNQENEWIAIIKISLIGLDPFPYFCKIEWDRWIDYEAWAIGNLRFIEILGHMLFFSAKTTTRSIILYCFPRNQTFSILNQKMSQIIGCRQLPCDEIMESVL